MQFIYPLIIFVLMILYVPFPQWLVTMITTLWSSKTQINYKLCFINKQASWGTFVVNAQKNLAYYIHISQVESYDKMKTLILLMY